MDEKTTVAKLAEIGATDVRNYNGVVIVDILNRARNPRAKAVYEFCESQGFKIEGAEPILKAVKIFSGPMSESEQLNW